VATPYQNSDLYWAMSGGGPGTYAMVLSMTAKLHPDSHVASANLTFAAAGTSKDTFYGVVSTFLQSLPAIVDSGAVSVWLLTGEAFVMAPTTAPGLSISELQKLMDPTLNALKQNNVSYQYYISDFPSYLDSYDVMNPEYNITDANIGGRLIPRSLVASNESTQNLTNAMRFINDNGAVVSGVSINVANGSTGPQQNSINPVWRTALFDAVVGVPWSEQPQDYQSDINSTNLVTDVLLPPLEEITPGGGAYINEGDFRQPDWQRVFYGVNYDRLKSIKDKYDPWHVLYAVTGVGSEYWKETADHRLCKT